MDANLHAHWALADDDRAIAQTFARERARLRGFIRRRVADPADAEDILQEVFYELVAAARMLQPLEQVGAWLFRVARNRIVDLFRKRRSENTAFYGDAAEPHADGAIEDWLPTAQAGPEAAYARRLLLDELEAALDELPSEQREVFIAHEIEGRSFKALSAQTGVSVNTLLSRKRYAVLHLRARLQAIHDEFVNNP